MTLVISIGRIVLTLKLSFVKTKSSNKKANGFVNR